jgi:hypothetical protein
MSSLPSAASQAAQGIPAPIDAARRGAGGVEAAFRVKVAEGWDARDAERISWAEETAAKGNAGSKGRVRKATTWGTAEEDMLNRLAMKKKNRVCGNWIRTRQ